MDRDLKQEIILIGIFVIISLAIIIIPPITIVKSDSAEKTDDKNIYITYDTVTVYDTWKADSILLQNDITLKRAEIMSAKSCISEYTKMDTIGNTELYIEQLKYNIIIAEKELQKMKNDYGELLLDSRRENKEIDHINFSGVLYNSNK